MVLHIKRRYILGAAFLLLSCIVFFIAFNYQNTPVQSGTVDKDAIYLPIIMYHEIKTSKLGKDAISPYEFESDLNYLQENNYTAITMTELIDYVYHDTPLPEKPIILSFDDGYLNNYVYVLPLLKQYHIKIVFSIIGKNTDDFTEFPSKSIDYAHVTWDQLDEMLDSGYVEVQNHTYNLHGTGTPRFGCMQISYESFDTYHDVLIKDIQKLQEEILFHTGKVPNTFAYPYGKSSENTDIILKEIGFSATLSCDYGINVITKDAKALYGLKRAGRAHGTTIEKVLQKAYKTIP
jgi:peptidoglycan/xylan/chitin deacetylase (PgdA/CDA1 family)